MYSVNLKLENKKCLVIGGGPVAERKTVKLIECGAAVTIISPEITPVLQSLAGRGILSHEKRSYRYGDLDPFFLVIACTGHPDVNSEIFKEAEAGEKLINSVDNPCHCNFYVPATIVRGDLTISISTSGLLPYFAGKLRQWMEKMFPPDVGKEIQHISGIRQQIIRECTYGEEEKKKRFKKDIDPLVKKLLRKIGSYAVCNRD
jgi:precorrin-2 dehydrogenase / sirohydrochlorin ferrochelatase